MRNFSLILFLSLISSIAIAQQVTQVDCCLNVGNKATIVINNTTNLIATNSISANTVVNNNGICNFKLSASANTSAGVYNASGNLVRTLWSGVRYAAGCYNVQWDGNLDDGTAAPLGVYAVKILSNNVTYAMQGGIGNTGNFTQNVFKGFSGINAIAFTATKGYWGENFSEGSISANTFNLNDLANNYKTAATIQARVMACVTDGTNIYWACRDDYHNQSFVYATKDADNSGVAFSLGQSITTGQGNGVYAYAIGVIIGGDQLTSYTSIAVNANYIFASRKSTNQLFVFNKTTGSLAQTISLSGISALACTTDRAIWVATSNAVNKYALNTDGSLGGNLLTLSTGVDVGLAVSPTTAELAVADSATEQVKFYNGSTGALNSTFGQLGGYVNNGPTVTYDKFMFTETRDNSKLISQPVIAFQPDGSFWLNDAGNYRCLHYNADKSYKEQITYVPACRSINADPNNPNRVFADTKEYYRDYTKTLGTPGSWYLKNNWEVGVSLDVYAQFVQVVTFPNGHTYATSGSTVYDLVQSTGPVNIGSISSTETLEADGSLYEKRNVSSPAYHPEIWKYPLTGYAGNGMPQWGNAILVANKPAWTAVSPYNYVNNTRGASTNQNRYFFFDPSIYVGYDGLQYHLSSVKTGQSVHEWQTSQITFPSYNGDYPRNGYFDVGNGNGPNGQHSENCLANVQGSNIFWHVNGEFWGANTGKAGAEINITNHYNEDGLFVGNFGMTAQQAGNGDNSGFAGNSYSTTLSPVGADLYYHTCDENTHSAICEWKISNLASIQEQQISLTVSAPVNLTAITGNLMTGLPYRSTTFTGGNGWIIDSPAGLSLSTNMQQFQKDSTDIAVGGNGSLSVRKYLNNTSLSSWSFSGGLGYQNSEPTFGTDNSTSDNYHYLELVDINGKIIARFTGDEADTRNSYYPRMWLNNVLVAQGGGVHNNYCYRDFSFVYNGSGITFKYSGYPDTTLTSVFETGANLSSPAYLRVSQYGNRNRYINLYKLKFVQGN